MSTEHEEEIDDLWGLPVRVVNEMIEGATRTAEAEAERLRPFRARREARLHDLVMAFRERVEAWLDDGLAHETPAHRRAREGHLLRSVGSHLAETLAPLGLQLEVTNVRLGVRKQGTAAVGESRT